LKPREFNAVLNYSNKIAQNAVSEMRKGFVKPIPFKDACEFCSYKGICGYDPSFEGERKTGTIHKKVIIEAGNKNSDQI
ncbi:MAG: hypothetical protein IKA39_04025, partial [Clostridia bacterium]|nr:hypothetical protein [Clostridia bacterium]